ncbi:MAG: AMP-binding protein, partial [Alphaproteobacteria bacterium]|nr:AMP-binding protein [Alphaproteobacteria bacterium]
MNYVTTLLDGKSERKALISANTGEQIAGAALSESVAGLAGAFRLAGVAPGDMVLLVCDLTPASLIAYLSVLYCGGIAVPVDANGVDQACTTLPLKAIWRPRPPREPDDLPTVVGLAMEDGPAAPCARADEELAALMPTSGSTGQPQFVQITHGNLLANNSAIIKTQALGPTDKVYLVLPLSYCFGLGAALTHLQAGGTVVLD